MRGKGTFQKFKNFKVKTKYIFLILQLNYSSAILFFHIRKNNLKNFRTLISALVAASSKAQVKCVNELIKAGATPNQRDSKGINTFENIKIK